MGGSSGGVLVQGGKYHLTLCRLVIYIFNHDSVVQMDHHVAVSQDQ